MGYSKDKVRYLKIFTDADGLMVFPIRRAVSTAMGKKRRELLGMKQEEINKRIVEHKIEVLVDLLAEEPQGIEDFPTTGTLAERAHAFFSDDRNFDLMNDIWEVYTTATRPSGAFLADVPGDKPSDAGAVSTAGRQGDGGVPQLPAQLREEEAPAG